MVGIPPLATENLLENTDGVLRPPQCSLGTAACYRQFMLTRAILIAVFVSQARRFYPVDLIKQTLTGLAMTKQNVLHLHLSDSPCWRVESKLYPQLTQTCSMVKGPTNITEDGMHVNQFIGFHRESAREH